MGQAPHREIDRDPGAEVRLRLCERAVAGDDRLAASRIEVDRPGRSYTVETLTLLRESSPEDELTLILGADQAQDLPTWRDPEGVLALATVAVAARAGLDEEAVLRRLDGVAGSERVAFFEMPRVDISSTLVRERVASGRPIRYLVPEPVAREVEEIGLYGATVPVSAE